MELQNLSKNNIKESTTLKDNDKEHVCIDVHDGAEASSPEGPISSKLPDNSVLKIVEHLNETNPNIICNEEPISSKLPDNFVLKMMENMKETNPNNVWNKETPSISSIGVHLAEHGSNFYASDVKGVKLISISTGIDGENAENVISYVARVSNPQNQKNYDTAPKLLAYCIRQKHWSVFETVSMTVEIVTSRAISAQLCRHRSFTFQEYSMRYAKALDHIVYPARRQDLKNRQNSIDDMSEKDHQWFKNAQEEVWELAKKRYDEALNMGIAKELARMVLPLSTQTTIMMTGNVRSFIHFIELRGDEAAQKEIRDIALQIKDIFCQTFANISIALGWK